jgi:hypothetical protein
MRGRSPGCGPRSGGYKCLDQLNHSHLWLPLTLTTKTRLSSMTSSAFSDLTESSRQQFSRIISHAANLCAHTHSTKALRNDTQCFMYVTALRAHTSSVFSLTLCPPPLHVCFHIYALASSTWQALPPAGSCVHQALF